VTISLTLITSATASLLEVIVFGANNIELEEPGVVSRRSARYIAEVEGTSSVIIIMLKHCFKSTKLDHTSAPMPTAVNGI
jgi:hypothetical protein